jgi:hypothetical protein
MPTLYIHAGLMTTGLLLVLSGALIAILLKRRRWWLLYHRFLGIAGTFIIAAGFAAAIIMVSRSAGQHFSTVHTWFGFSTVLLAATTALLGFLQFNRKIKMTSRPVFRRMHRWSGRITLTLLFVSVLSGLHLAGIV